MQLFPTAVFFGALTFCAAVFCETDAKAADVSGTWTGSSPGPCQNSPTAICDDGLLRTYRFVQNGHKLTGTLDSISRARLAMRLPSPPPVQIVDGKIEGNRISFSWYMLTSDIKLRAHGTIANDNIMTLMDEYFDGGSLPPANAVPYTMKRQQ